MPDSLFILHIEDSESDAQLIAHLLQQTNHRIIIERVETASQMQAALHQQAWDVIISDYSLPQFSAQAALKILKQLDLDIPFLVVSGAIGEETAVLMMRSGAHDYIMKHDLARLLPAIERETTQAEIREKHRRAEMAVREAEQMAQAAVDTLSAHVAILDNTGTIIAVNHAWRAFVHANATHLDGLCEGGNYLATCDTATNLYSADAQTMAAAIRAIMRGDLQQYTLDYLYHSHNQKRWFHAHVARFIQNNTTRIIITHDDVTKYKMAEQRIETQLQYLSTLREMNVIIIDHRDLRFTLSALLTHVATQLNIDAASVLLYHPEAATLNFAAGYGFTSTLGPHEHLAGHIIQDQTATSTFIDPQLIHPHPDFQMLWDTEGFQHYRGIPLAINGDIKGLLEVFHRNPHNAGIEWTTYLAALAGQFALAIDSAQLFANLEYSNQELSSAYNSAIEGWSRALDMRDKETEGHSQRVTEMTERLAQALGIHGVELQHIRWGALLHDIGKMGVPDAILLKPGPLTDEEWVLMKRHPQLAYDMLSPIAYLQQSLDIPFCHHEKWNGTGYPCGLKGEEIPLAARLFAVVDVWDALKSDRPYRPGWHIDKILAHISSLAGSHFDPMAVELFLQVILGDSHQEPQSIENTPQAAYGESRSIHQLSPSRT